MINNTKTTTINTLVIASAIMIIGGIMVIPIINGHQTQASFPKDKIIKVNINIKGFLKKMTKKFVCQHSLC